MAQQPTILIIEDDQEIRRFLRASLADHGYRLIESETGQGGLDLVADEHPGLVLLDLGLPDTDGLSVIRRLRGWSQVPIIVISARGREADKVKALDGGADDYLTKPFSVVELQARMRVALRHATQDQEEAGQPIFTLRNLRVDLERRQVFVAEKEIHLMPIEFRILTTLIKHSGKVVTHRRESATALDVLRRAWLQCGCPQSCSAGRMMAATPSHSISRSRTTSMKKSTKKLSLTAKCRTAHLTVQPSKPSGSVARSTHIKPPGRAKRPRGCSWVVGLVPCFE